MKQTMKTVKIVSGIVAILWTFSLQVCTAQQIYSIPNTAASAQWVKIGSFNTIEQGQDVFIQIVSSNGYNASIGQDQVSYIHFKTSNGGSVDGNGFGGDSWWYTTGPNNAAPGAIKWVANAAGNAATSFTLYAYFGAFTGTDSFYMISNPPGNSWTNSSVGGQTDPGAGNSTVLIATNQMFIGSNASFGGNVGVGTSSPGAKLEVSGNLKFTAGSGGSITFQDGTTQATAYTGVVCGGDYAESVDVTGSRTSYEPGDVLVLDPNTQGKFLKANDAYSTLVAGIYSTKPGTVGRRQTTSKSPDEVPMAMMGIVPTKVTAENGPIKTGDLLVASSTPGRAMKGTDRGRMLGAVIGKAMGSLDSGTGVIEVLVTLQ